MTDETKSRTSRRAGAASVRWLRRSARTGANPRRGSGRDGHCPTVRRIGHARGGGAAMPSIGIGSSVGGVTERLQDFVVFLASPAHPAGMRRNVT